MIGLGKRTGGATEGSTAPQMHGRRGGRLAALLAGFAGCFLAARLAATSGEPPDAPARRPQAAAERGVPRAESLASRPGRALDSPETIFCQSLYNSAKRGARWLQRSQRPDGLFVYGWIPCLNEPLPEENYLRQAGAAAALARTAAVTRDAELTQAALRAVRALLTSLTVVDRADPGRRRPRLPPAEAHPIGLTALILLAVAELPAPTDDVLEPGEQLARFLVARQRPDGSFNLTTSFLDDDGEDPPGASDYFPGEALYALLRSYPNRGGAWKLQAVSRAFPFYRQLWQTNPSLAFVPWQSAAFTEAYLLTADPAYAEFVFALNDWLVAVQYDDPARVEPAWLGGFGSVEHGQFVPTPPGITTASYAESLVEACRVARQAGDAKRLERYRRAAENALRFLSRQQFSAANTTHFVSKVREQLNGAFYASVQDGTVRIDFTQHAICSMLHYLTHVADFETPARRGSQLSPALPKAN